MGLINHPSFVMKAKKSLGQNFLIDNKIIDKIVLETSASCEDLIIEIGPGRGALSKELKKKNCYILAYELDTDLKPILDNICGDRFKVIYKDFLSSNIKEDIKDYKYNNLYLVGNLPYYITTPIIEHVIDQDLNFIKFTIMVQKEVADRFMAVEKTKDYGYITLVLKYYFEVVKVCDVSKYAFNPVPKVESTVVSLISRKNKPDVDSNLYFTFLKNCFKQKRKTLKNNLNSMYNWEKIKIVLDKYDLPDSVRAEELSETIFLDIFKHISK